MTRSEKLRSDLKDSRNPKVVERYPHLGSPGLIRQLEDAIESEEERSE